MQYEQENRFRKQEKMIQKYKNLFETASDGIHILDYEGNILECNEAFASMLGYSVDEICKLSIFSIDSAIEQEIFPDFVHSLLDAPRSFMSKHKCKDESLIDVQIQTKRIDMDGQAYIYASSRNITEYVFANNEIKNNKAAFKKILESIHEGILVFDETRHCIYANKAVEEILGYTNDELIGLFILHHVPPEYVELIKNKAAENDASAFEAKLLRKDGKKIHVKLQGHNLSLWGQNVRLVGILDISEFKNVQEQVEKLAYYDSLTNLPNRRLLYDRLEQARIRSQRNNNHAIILFIDLDNFKRINDTLGHKIGDTLLVHAAHRIENIVRESDTVARIGGDEFVILAEHNSDNKEEILFNATRLAQKIIEVFKEPFIIEDKLLHITTSIGIAIIDNKLEEIDTILSQADIAMYSAKNNGRNSYHFFDDAMQAIIHNQLSLEVDLHNALKNNEFVLYYQPQIDNDGCIIGAEALIRWKHPERGLVSPAEFIPVAETNGMIIPIGKWVIQEGCRTLNLWSKDAVLAKLTLSLNISASHFLHSDFKEYVEYYIDFFDIDPTKLQIELTESIFVDERDKVREIMMQLHEIGIHLSLDDFGTGYSSLSYVRTFPIDELKIDQSFVQAIRQEEVNADKIVEAILLMGNAIELQSIAEGIENEQEFIWLKKLGCQRFQGYYFSRPIPFEAFKKWTIEIGPSIGMSLKL